MTKWHCVCKLTEDGENTDHCAFLRIFLTSAYVSVRSCPFVFVTIDKMTSIFDLYRSLSNTRTFIPYVSASGSEVVLECIVPLPFSKGRREMLSQNSFLLFFCSSLFVCLRFPSFSFCLLFPLFYFSRVGWHLLSFVPLVHLTISCLKFGLMPITVTRFRRLNVKRV